jgi:adenine-specific DNA glycosylase
VNCISVEFSKLFDCRVHDLQKIAQLSQTFSHLRWDVTVFSCDLDDLVQISPGYRWVEKNDITCYAFPAIYKDFIKQI